MIPWTIRQARPDDAAQIADTEARTAATPGLLVARPGELPLHGFREKIEALERHGRYLVAEAAGVVVGHAFLDPMGLAAVRHVFHLTIVVAPEHTGHGIGRALLEELLRWAEGDGRVEKVELRVRASNQRAIALYDSVGFVEEGRLRARVKLPDGSRVDDIAMAWFPGKSHA